MEPNLDLVIVVVYTICIVWVFYNAIASLEEQTIMVIDKTALTQQLTERTLGDLTLADVLEIKFKLDDRYKFQEQPKAMGITISNKSAHLLIKADWDRSSISDYGNRLRRVIRLTPDKRIDLSQPQIFSVIAPGGSLQELITAEDLLQLNVDGSLSPVKPILDFDKLKSDKSKKELYAKFTEGKAPLTFTIRLALRITDLDDDERGDRLRMIPCTFIITKVPWQDYLPFNPRD